MRKDASPVSVGGVAGILEAVAAAMAGSCLGEICFGAGLGGCAFATGAGLGAGAGFTGAASALFVAVDAGAGLAFSEGPSGTSDGGVVDCAVPAGEAGAGAGSGGAGLLDAESVGGSTTPEVSDCARRLWTSPT